jgi:hypothetical protein
MKPLTRSVAWFVFWATLVVAAVLGLFLAWVYSEGLPPGTVITIDEDRFVMPALEHFGHWAALVIGVLIVAIVLVLLVPLVTLLVIVVPTVLGGLGIAIAIAPAALAVWLLWLIFRKPRQTTIAP